MLVGNLKVYGMTCDAYTSLVMRVPITIEGGAFAYYSSVVGSVTVTRTLRTIVVVLSFSISASLVFVGNYHYQEKGGGSASSLVNYAVLVLCHGSGEYTIEYDDLGYILGTSKTTKDRLGVDVNRSISFGVNMWKDYRVGLQQVYYLPTRSAKNRL